MLNERIQAMASHMPKSWREEWAALPEVAIPRTMTASTTTSTIQIPPPESCSCEVASASSPTAPVGSLVGSAVDPPVGSSVGWPVEPDEASATRTSSS